MTSNSNNRKSNNQSSKGGNRSTAPRSRQDSSKNRMDEALKEERDREMKLEIGTIAFVIVMILLFLCNFHIIGAVGDAISGFLFGVFGWLAYITPLFAIVLLFLFKKFKYDSKALRKIYTSIGLYFLIAIICDMVTKTSIGMEKYNFSELYKRGRDTRCGGGLISGSIAYLIKSGLGMVGLVLLLIFGILVCLVVITEKSIIGFIQSKGGEMISKSKRDREEYRERSAARREREELDEEETPRLPDHRTKLQAESAKRHEEAEADSSTDDTALAVPYEEEYLEPVNEPVVDTGYKQNWRDKFKQSYENNKEKQRQKSLLKKEAAQNDEILKTAPPLPQNYGKGYIPEYSQEVHEIQYYEDETGYAQNEPDYSHDQEYTTEAEYSSDEPVYDSYIEQKPRFKKQEIRSQHGISVSEEFSPIDGEPLYEEEITDSDIVVPAYTAPVVKPTVKPVAKPMTNSFDNEDYRSGAENVKKDAPRNKAYQFPPLNLLKAGKSSGKSNDSELEITKQNLQNTLRNFGVNVTITEAVQGPSVTRYEMTLEPGTKVSKILGLSDDIKLSLACADVRIEAPIPGKSAVGIEVPNKENSTVSLRELLENRNFKESSSTLSFAVGKNIGGEVIVTDIAKMPHVLIAGATGSGKSVCINTLIMSILYKSSPEDVQLIMVDPKVVELSVYNGIPHLMLPVVTDPKKASAALAWGVKEMEDRYRKFADLNVRDLAGYNEKVINLSDEEKGNHFKLPKIVIIIDELADLMMVCGKEVEEAICRLAQLARACGIHLVVATQRPSVDVITGLIKANMPSRMAFAVSSGTDSRTILDQVGAEKLLGKGDMLFFPQGKSKPERVQGAFVSDEEVSNVVDFLKEQRMHNTFAERSGISADTLDEVSQTSAKGAAASADAGDGRDELFADAGRCIINSGKASIGYLQRMLKIGFNRAARIMDSLAEEGVVGPESGTKARDILMSIEEFEAYIDNTEN